MGWKDCVTEDPDCPPEGGPEQQPEPKPDSPTNSSPPPTPPAGPGTGKPPGHGATGNDPGKGNTDPDPRNQAEDEGLFGMSCFKECMVTKRTAACAGFVGATPGWWKLATAAVCSAVIAPICASECP